MSKETCTREVLSRCLTQGTKTSNGFESGS